MGWGAHPVGSDSTSMNKGPRSGTLVSTVGHPILCL